MSWIAIRSVSVRISINICESLSSLLATLAYTFCMTQDNPHKIHTLFVPIYSREKQLCLCKIHSKENLFILNDENEFQFSVLKSAPLFCGCKAFIFNENHKTIRQIYKINIKILHKSNERRTFHTIPKMEPFKNTYFSLIFSSFLI